ncbi:uncharacterized protein LOC111895023 [Lactuca sativa]|uniref:uncharacterized protein LOC111895023 n=1 Tax=Lactuca sativa TaxID=4236 RepID=UPI0022AEACAB|nr:uncharacterized protein LOC111895023 [Lactuca sativa]
MPKKSKSRVVSQGMSIGRLQGEKNLLICYNCKKSGHHWKNCRDPPTSAVPHITSAVPVCYHCNETGHKKPECPKFKTGKGDGDTNPVIASSSKGTTMVTRGHAHQMIVEEPVITTTVACTYLLDSEPDVVMFDSGATHSFISHTFINRLGRSIGKLAHPMVVDVADNRTIYVTDVYRGYTLEFSGVEFPIDLIPIAMRDLCVIVGMDWLDAFDVEIHCRKKQVRVRNPRAGELIIQGDIPRLAMASCSSAIALDNVPIISDFNDVFLEELPGFPPIRKVEFRIDLVPGATLVAKSPYRLAPPEMKELQDQLQELTNVVADGLRRKQSVEPIQAKCLRITMVPSLLDVIWDAQKTTILEENIRREKIGKELPKME